MRLVGLDDRIMLNDVGSSPCCPDGSCDCLSTEWGNVPHISMLADPLIMYSAFDLNAFTNKMINGQSNGTRFYNYCLNRKNELGDQFQSNIPYYTSLSLGGPFLDDVGNIIFCKFLSVDGDDDKILNPTWDPYYSQGFYNCGDKKPYIMAQKIERYDNNFVEDTLTTLYERLIDKSENGLISILSTGNRKYDDGDKYQVRINQEKYDRPILFIVYRKKAISVNQIISAVVSTLTTIIDGFLPGAGTALNLGFVTISKSLVKDVLSLIKEGSQKGWENINVTENLLKFTSAYLPQESFAYNYIKDGTNLYTAYQNRDYFKIASSLGISSNLANKTAIDTYIQNNDVLTVLNQSNKSGGFDELNALFQNYRNAAATENIINTIANGKIYEDVQQYEKSKTFRDVLEITCSGGYSGAIPLTAKCNLTKEDLSLVSLITSSSSNAELKTTQLTPEGYRAMMCLATQSPVDANALDYLLLMSIENDLRSLPKGSDYVLPAGLPADKKECFAKELAARGFNIYTGTLEVLNEEKKKKSLKERLSKDKTQKYRKEFK